MTFREALQPGIEAARRNVRPSLLIFVLAVASLIAYYQVSAVRELVGAWKPFHERWGLAANSLLTIIASMVLPLIARLLTGSGHGYRDVRDLFFRLAFFGMIGPIVELWYGFLSGWLGTGTSVGLIALKVVIDQLVLSPLVTIPYTTIAFWWRDSNFSIREMKNSQEGFLPRYAPLMVGCWAFWFPMLITVFAMPSELQFCMYVFLQAAWSLIIVTIERKA
jgi:hypothetical protein